VGPLAPYLALGWLVSLLLIGAGAAWKATSIAKEHCQVAIGKLVVESQQRKDQEAAAATKAARKLEADNAKVRQRLREVRAEQDRLVARLSRVRCLDADGLRAVRDALAGQGRAAAGSSPAVPVPAPAH